MKPGINIPLTLMLLVWTGLSGMAQEWTKAQLEVWQVVETSRAKWKAGDIDGFGATLHEKFQGWDNLSALPQNKEQTLQRYRESKEMSKIDHFAFNPARISVTTGAAVVDYYFRITQTTGQVTRQFTGKNVEFYVKEGGKWLLMGDMTSFDPEK